MWRYALIIGIIMGIIATGYGVWSWYDNQHAVRIVISDINTRLPETITLIRGQRDTLVIANQSQQPITVAGSVIAPDQQLRQYYRNAGEFTFSCSVHGGQSLRVIVRDP
jgi:plastocyanin